MACPGQPQHPAPEAVLLGKDPGLASPKRTESKEHPCSSCTTGTEGLPQGIPLHPKWGGRGLKTPPRPSSACRQQGLKVHRRSTGLPAKPGGEGRAGRPVTLLGREVPTQPTTAEWVSDSDDKNSSRHPGRQAQTWTVTVREREAMAEALCPDVSVGLRV